MKSNAACSLIRNPANFANLAKKATCWRLTSTPWFAKFALFAAAVGLCVAGLCTTGVCIPPVLAKDRNGAFWGFGTTPCVEFLAARENKSDVAYKWWLAGYMTAMNNVTPDTYNLVASETLADAMQRIEGWCQENPDKSMTDATIALSRDLYPKRQIVKPAQ